jgi:hypothetical protein
MDMSISLSVTVPRVDLARLRTEFPTVEISPSFQHGPTFRVAAEDWESPAPSFWDFDVRLDDLADRGPVRIEIDAPPDRRAAMALEVLTRCQRRTGRRNEASSQPLFDRALARHREIHDLGQPLERADWAHSLDVWQWTLRLDPEASLEAQLAALFHDIERLKRSEHKRREVPAAIYQSFKDEHARRGAELAEALLAEIGFDDRTRQGVARLIAGHERPPDNSGERDPALLNDADALSFFSLNSPGYVDYFGPEAARRKIAWTLARLSPAARRRLDGVRLRPDVAEMLAMAERSPEEATV